MPTLSSTDREALATTVRVSRIIVAAMIMGSLVFLVTALAISPLQAEPNQNEIHLLTFLAIGFVLAAMVARVVVRRAMVQQRRQAILHADPDLPTEVTALAMLFQTRLIVSLALIEGPTFFLLITYMLERSPLALAVAAALIVAMALHWPTTASMVNWLEQELAIIEQDRQFKRS